MPPGAAERMLEMPRARRRRVRMVGMLLMAAGLAFLALSFAMLLRLGPDPGPETAGDGLAAMVVYLFLGCALLLAGVFLLRLGFLGRGETDAENDAEDHEAAKEQDVIPPEATGPRALCQGCGHLERPTARHCSGCGAPL